MSALPEWLPMAALVLFMPVMWVTMSLLFSVLSGWRRLSLRWAMPDPDQRPPTHLSSGRVGLVRYKNALLVGGDEKGLVLGVMVLFRLGHPWVRVPWSRVEAAAPSGRYFPRQQLHLDSEGSSVRITLPASVAGELLAARPPT